MIKIIRENQQFKIEIQGIDGVRITIYSPEILIEIPDIEYDGRDVPLHDLLRIYRAMEYLKISINEMYKQLTNIENSK